MLWSDSDATSWHPSVDVGRVRDAWRAAEAYVSARCRWPEEAAPPADLMQAVKLLTARLLARHNSPDGLAAGGGDLGPARISSVDRDVEALMAPWRPVVFG